MKNETQRHLLAAVLIALILGFVGSMAVEDEENNEKHYCQMVADGMWPEYRKDEINCDE